MNADRFVMAIWPVAPLVDWTPPVELFVADVCAAAAAAVVVADATDTPAVKEENEGRVTPALEQRVCA